MHDFQVMSKWPSLFSSVLTSLCCWAIGAMHYINLQPHALEFYTRTLKSICIHQNKHSERLPSTPHMSIVNGSNIQHWPLELQVPITLTLQRILKSLDTQLVPPQSKTHMYKRIAPFPFVMAAGTESELFVQCVHTTQLPCLHIQ